MRNIISIENLVKEVARVMQVELRTPHFPFWPLYLAAAACETVCKPLGLTPPLFRRRADWYRQNRAFKIDKAKRELGYQPKINLREGLTRTYVWYREQGY